MTDITKVRETIKSLEELGIPFHIIQDLKQWANQKAKEQGRELTDVDLAELNTFLDKLDATGHEVYTIQFSERLEELSKETGLTIPEIKNRGREYRNRR